MQYVDDEDKGGTQIDTPGGRQNIATVNESGNAIVVPDGSTPFVQVPTPTE